MELDRLKNLWRQAIAEILNSQINESQLEILAKQSIDSIRRIEIYRAYRIRADQAVFSNKSYIFTSNPFVLCQRPDLEVQDKVWIIYLATYFGKSDKSKWELFERAAFNQKKSFFSFALVKSDLDMYFQYLSSIDFFQNCNYSNHRKFTAKKLQGEKGFFRSVEYFVKNIDEYTPKCRMDFHKMFQLSQKIPNFGRLAGFDFTSSLVKCGVNVDEPLSMYAENSTGPLQGLGLLLRLTSNNSSKSTQIKLSHELTEWFLENSKIFMVGQVLEDAICNWQKNTRTYIKYKG